jgi:hypothetical protein
MAAPVDPRPRGFAFGWAAIICDLLAWFSARRRDRELGVASTQQQSEHATPRSFLKRNLSRRSWKAKRPRPSAWHLEDQGRHSEAGLDQSARSVGERELVGALVLDEGKTYGEAGAEVGVSDTVVRRAQAISAGKM